MTRADAPTIWAVSDGRAGIRAQALGLAEATARLTGAVVTEKRLAIRRPWDRLPARAWGDPFARLAAGSDDLAPPWPDVLIGCGRRAVPFAEAMPERTLTVMCQDPRVKPARFGLVVPPVHDGLDGANVFAILGSPNRLTEARLAADAAKLEAALPPLPRPLTALLIGGDSKDHRMTPAGVAGILDVAEACAGLGQGLLVSYSRRTPEAAIAALTEGLENLPAWIWDGRDVPDAGRGGLRNPYFGMLGLAGRVLVTSDSANMVTEAAFTGRPVHLLPLQGGGAKWRRFHAGLAAHGVLRPDAGLGDDWTYPPLRETDRAAQVVVAAMAERGLLGTGG